MYVINNKILWLSRLPVHGFLLPRNTFKSSKSYNNKKAKTQNQQFYDPSVTFGVEAGDKSGQLYMKSYYFPIHSKALKSVIKEIKAKNPISVNYDPSLNHRGIRG